MSRRLLELASIVARLAFCGVLAASAADAVAFAQDVPCRTSDGPKRAAQYVRHCKDVSPATHPPCNAENACSLIISEINRGCAMLGADAPKFCADYSGKR